MKLVTNGADTKDITFYITLYIAKRQIQAANESALLAKGLEIHQKFDARQKRMTNMNKRLLQRCANTLSRQHEFSAPEVVNYLMGWGDRLISHRYVPIYWDQVTFALRKEFPTLLHPQSISEPDATMVRDNQTRDRVDEQTSGALSINERGQFVLKDQLKQYQDRGHALDDMSFYDFFMLTYDGEMLEERAATDGPARGRPRSVRVPYLPEANWSGCRVIRGEQHETNLHFIGRWFPRANDPAVAEYYAAQMLLLLCPWRSLQDLKNNHPTFQSALTAFKSQAAERDLRILENIQYFYQCSDRAAERRQAENEASSSAESFQTPEGDNAAGMDTELPEPTDQDIQQARRDRYAAREHIFGTLATEIAKDCGIFARDDTLPVRRAEVRNPGHERASEADMVKFAKWGETIAAWDRSTGSVARNTAAAPDLGGVVVPHVVPNTPAVDLGGVIDVTPEAATPLPVLNPEQRRSRHYR
ncbi:ATP-dependent DNA helicase [Mycena chlorophos]|uniref:ATP-dependent DNA helicase n=1 Tax=Mycena chlorophos TaxID=658473 RepID=A0A8H6SUI0_MYCCL|nr:ATP-dependent DNA helicase [Mycena chlorophos]